MTDDLSEFQKRPRSGEPWVATGGLLKRWDTFVSFIHRLFS